MDGSGGEGWSVVHKMKVVAFRRAFLAAGVTVLQVDPVGSDPLGDVRKLRMIVDSL